ncbi:MAG: hypothetical protein J0H69_08555 [Burkholderiales bacterium]|nr:hypothetical protein [Burkholderiales bacterium]
MLFALKLLMLTVVIGGIAYAAVFIFPRKMRLLRRIGLDKTNSDVLALAKRGDEEAQALVRQSKRLLWVVLPTAFLLSVVHSLSRM